MSEFKNVTAVKKANIYFDGKVTSRTVILKDGERKTLGIMLPGEYTFTTGHKEVMEIVEGYMEVKLPDSESYVSYKTGDKFEVPGHSSFELRVKEVSDYCCSYIKE